MDRRRFTLALAGLGMEAVAGKTPTYPRPVAAKPHLLPTLRRYAKFPWPQCVRAAMPLLLPLGDFVPLLLDLLADDDAEMRLFAIDLLAEVPPDQRSLPALVTALNDFDPLVRVWAVGQVVDFGPRAKAAVPALLTWLTPRDCRVPIFSTCAGPVIGVGFTEMHVALHDNYTILVAGDPNISCRFRWTFFHGR